MMKETKLEAPPKRKKRRKLTVEERKEYERERYQANKAKYKAYHQAKKEKMTEEQKEKRREYDRTLHRSEKGKLKALYQAMKANSEYRQHPKPDFSFEQFKTWAYENDYLSLHQAWEKSNFLRAEAPSTDRISNDLPYTFDNLQLVAWRVNNEKENEVRKKPVFQYDLNGNFLKEFESITAARVSIKKRGVSQCLNGRSRTAGGFKWRYKEDAI